MFHKEIQRIHIHHHICYRPFEAVFRYVAFSAPYLLQFDIRPHTLSGSGSIRLIVLFRNNQLAIRIMISYDWGSLSQTHDVRSDFRCRFLGFFGFRAEFPHGFFIISSLFMLLPTIWINVGERVPFSFEDVVMTSGTYRFQNQLAIVYGVDEQPVRSYVALPVS